MSMHIQYLLTPSYISPEVVALLLITSTFSSSVLIGTTWMRATIQCTCGSNLSLFNLRGHVALSWWLGDRDGVSSSEASLFDDNSALWEETAGCLRQLGSGTAPSQQVQGSGESNTDDLGFCVWLEITSNKHIPNI